MSVCNYNVRYLSMKFQTVILDSYTFSIMPQNASSSKPQVNEPLMMPIETEASENSNSAKQSPRQTLDENLEAKRRKVGTDMKRGFCVCPFRIDPELKDEDSKILMPFVDKWVSNLPKNGKVRTPDLEGEKPIMMIIPILVKDANQDPPQEDKSDI